MTKKDGDKLREMKADLEHMASEYALPIHERAAGFPGNESLSMSNLAKGIQFLLEGNYVYLTRGRRQ